MLKLNKIVLLVMEWVIFLVKEESAQLVKEEKLLRKVLIFKFQFLQVLPQVMPSQSKTKEMKSRMLELEILFSLSQNSLTKYLQEKVRIST